MVSPTAQAIDVQNAEGIVKVVICGDLHGLSLRALGQFTVSQKHVGHVRQLVQVFGIRGQATPMARPCTQWCHKIKGFSSGTATPAK